MISAILIRPEGVSPAMKLASTSLAFMMLFVATMVQRCHM